MSVLEQAIKAIFDKGYQLAYMTNGNMKSPETLAKALNEEAFDEFGSGMLESINACILFFSMQDYRQASLTEIFEDIFCLTGNYKAAIAYAGKYGFNALIEAHNNYDDFGLSFRDGAYPIGETENNRINTFNHRWNEIVSNMPNLIQIKDAQELAVLLFKYK